MSTKNDITGDKIETRSPSQKYLDNYDQIFGGGCEDKPIESVSRSVARRLAIQDEERPVSRPEKPQERRMPADGPVWCSWTR